MADYSGFEKATPSQASSSQQQQDGPYSGFRRVTDASPALDVAEQTVWGFNQGIDNLLNLPIDLLVRLPAHYLGLENYLPPRGRLFGHLNPGGAVHRALPFTTRTEDAPRTTAGEYARSVGEALGASALPTGALVGTSRALASLAPTTVPRAIGQYIGSNVAANPAAAVGADVVASVGSGLAQQAAADAGAGPLGQAYAGVAGAFAPTAVTSTIGGLRRSLAGARASSDPYARVLAGLGDATVDDLANAVAVGTTRQDLGINRRTLDILGEEMVASGGNRTAAVRATEARLIADGVVPATAQEQIRRLIAVHSGNNLMLGEFPAVTAGNMATRDLSPYAPRGQVGRRAVDIWQEEFTRAGGNVATAEQSTIDRLIASGVTRQRATQAIRDIRAGRATDVELGAVTEPGTQQLIDMVANAGSMASSQGVRAAVIGRAANLGERLLDMVRGLSPGGRTIRDVENMVTALRQQASSAYDAVYNTPGAVNQGALYAGLSRVFRNHLARLAGRGGAVRDELSKAIDSFYVTTPQGTAGREAIAQRPDVLAARTSQALLAEDIVAARLALREARRQRVDRATIDQMSRNIDDLVERARIARRDAAITTDRSLPTSLRVVQDARTELRGAITSNADNPAVAAALRSLYRDVTSVMERASPTWARANRQWADMNLEVVATELGDAFAKGAGPQLRQQLREFQQLAPAAQDVVRVHFVQKLLDEIEHEVRLNGQTNLGKLFDRQDKRQMIRAILGDQAANAIVRATRDANVMARTMGGIRGSQTHLRGQVQREQDADLQAIASAAQFDWRNWRAAAFERILAMIREGRNRTVGRAVTTPMRDVPAVAEQIERMRRAADRLAAANTPPTRQLPIAGTVLPSLTRLTGQ